MQTDTYIPRRLDDAWKIGFWDVDVASPFLFCLFLGYLTSTKLGFAACLAIGVLLSRWVGRMKSDKHPSFVLHWAIWALPSNPVTVLRATPPTHIRRMVG